MIKHDWISFQLAIFSRPQALGRGANGKLVEKIPESARYEHDKKRENAGGNPPSEHQNSEYPFLYLFTPPQCVEKAEPAGADDFTESSSWNCAFN